jgi:hypothetical protein
VILQTLYLTVNTVEQCSRSSLKILESILCRAEMVLASHNVSDTAPLRRVSSRGRSRLSVRHGSPLEATRYDVLSYRHQHSD